MFIPPATRRVRDIVKRGIRNRIAEMLRRKRRGVSDREYLAAVALTVIVNDHRYDKKYIVKFMFDSVVGPEYKVRLLNVQVVRGVRNYSFLDRPNIVGLVGGASGPVFEGGDYGSAGFPHGF